MNVSDTSMIEISIGISAESDFLSFETVELKPNQVVWLQTQEGKDYRLLIREGVGAETFNIEINGGDIIVRAPNGGVIVLRDYAITVGDKLKEELFFRRKKTPTKRKRRPRSMIQTRNLTKQELLTQTNISQQMVAC